MPELFVSCALCVLVCPKPFNYIALTLGIVFALFFIGLVALLIYKAITYIKVRPGSFNANAAAAACLA